MTVWDRLRAELDLIIGPAELDEAEESARITRDPIRATPGQAYTMNRKAKTEVASRQKEAHKLRQQGLNQIEIGEAMGIGQSTVSGLFNREKLLERQARYWKQKALREKI